MKRILMFISLAALIFMMTSVVLAEGSVKFECIPSGSDMVGSEGNYWDAKQTGKLSSYYLSADALVNDFKFGFEYGTGTDEFKTGDIFDTKKDYDYTMSEFRLGARVFDRDRIKLDLMFSKLQVQLKESGDKIDLDGFLLGCDVIVPINEKFTFDGYLGYSFFGATYKENGEKYEPAYLLGIKANVNYAVSEHTALTLGARDLLCSVSDYQTDTIDGLGRSIGGYSIGVKYSF